jgi:ribose transport system permease protein
LLNIVVNFLKKHMLILFYSILTLIIMVITDDFYNSFNIASILGLGSIMGFLVLGEAIVVLTGGIDISVGNIASLSSVVFAWAMLNFNEVFPVPVVITICILFSILCGALMGFINGFSVAKLGIPPIIATLAVYSISYGFAEYIFSAKPTYLEINSFSVAVRAKFLGIFPFSSIIFIVFVIIISLILRRTIIGRYIYAIGGSKEASFLSGIKHIKILIYCYISSGILSAIGGIFLAGWMRVGDARSASGYEFIAITAVIMGGISLFGGEGDIWDAVLGIITLQTIRKIIPRLQISTFYEEGIIGVILLIAVAINIMNLQRKTVGNSTLKNII